MPKSEYTNGPWMLVDTPAIRDIFNGCSVVAAEGIDDAIIAAIGGDIPETEANARLIAAAPELLEALKEAEKFVDRHSESWYTTGQELLTKTRAVIAKAEGK